MLSRWGLPLVKPGTESLSFGRRSSADEFVSRGDAIRMLPKEKAWLRKPQ
jgi:hypothetical protein